MENIDGVGFIGGISADGRVVGGTLAKQVETESGPVDQERAALWTRATGWKSIADESLQGCDIFHSSVWDVNGNGSAAVGLGWNDCSDAFAFKWTAKRGLKRLHKISEGASRANAVSADGKLVGGWEEIPEGLGTRVDAVANLLARRTEGQGEHYAAVPGGQPGPLSFPFRPRRWRGDPSRRRGSPRRSQRMSGRRPSGCRSRPGHQAARPSGR